MPDAAVPPKPRLKRGETPQSESFQKRMREYQRALALHEATEAQKELNAEREARDAKRDVLAEAKGPAPKKEAPKPATPPAGSPKTEKKDESVADKLRNRPKKIDSIVDAAISGIHDANDENGVKRK